MSRAWNCSRLAATGREDLLGGLEALLRPTVSTALPCRSATSWDSSRNWSTIACRPAAISSDAREGGVALGDGPGHLGLGLGGADAGVGGLRCGLGRLGPGVGSPRGASSRRRGSRDARPAGAGAEADDQREEHEEGGVRHGGIVTQTTDRTPDHTPGSTPSPTLPGMAPLVAGRATTLVAAAGAALVLAASPALAVVTATTEAATPSSSPATWRPTSSR